MIWQDHASKSNQNPYEIRISKSNPWIIDFMDYISEWTSELPGLSIHICSIPR